MGLKIKYFNYLVRQKMFFLLYFVWFILIELAIQKTESPTNINQQRRIRYKVQCPYSLPVGVDLSKARMCERYGSPYPGAPEQWYLEKIVDVVTDWTIARGNYSIHKVIRYGLKTSACNKKLMITSANYSDIGRDLQRFYSHDVYNCVAFYKEGWEYIDFSPV